MGAAGESDAVQKAEVLLDAVAAEILGVDVGTLEERTRNQWEVATSTLLRDVYRHNVPDYDAFVGQLTAGPGQGQGQLQYAYTGQGQ